MNHRRLSHSTRKSPAMTGGDDQPLGPCRHYPDVFGSLNDGYRNNPDWDEHVEAAKNLCGSCPLRDACHAENAGEAWLAAITTGRKRPGRPAAPINHGTYAGAIAHHNRGEEPCDECREARNVYQREHRKTTKLEALDKGRAAHRANLQASNGDRLADLQALAKAGAGIEETCDALGVNRHALWRWCDRNGHRDLWFAISPRKPKAVVSRSRRKKAAA